MTADKDEVQIANFIKYIKSRIYFPDTDKQFSTVEVANIIIEIENRLSTNLSPEAARTLRVLLAIEIEKGQQIRAKTRVFKTTTRGGMLVIKDEIQQKDEAFLSNEEREKELELLNEEYLSFKDKFHKQLDEEYALLEKAAKGELTEQERNSILGKYSSNEEPTEAREDEDELSYRWNVHHKANKALDEFINFSQSEIDHNTSKRKRNDLTPIHEVNKQKTIQHSENKKHYARGHTHIEKSRRVILKIAEKENKLAIVLAERHNRVHGEYENRNVEQSRIKKLAKLRNILPYFLPPPALSGNINILCSTLKIRQ